MKKILSLFMMAIMLAGCSLVKDFPANMVSVDDIQKKIDSKENFILVVANKERCGTCESYLKGGIRGLHDKNDYKIDYITIDTLDKQAEIDKLANIIYKEFNETEQMIGVPTTYIVSDGKIAETLKGPVLYDNILKKYKKYIK